MVKEDTILFIQSFVHLFTLHRYLTGCKKKNHIGTEIVKQKRNFQMKNMVSMSLILLKKGTHSRGRRKIK
jgi:hypothetical protein